MYLPNEICVRTLYFLQYKYIRYYSTVTIEKKMYLRVERNRHFFWNGIFSSNISIKQNYHTYIIL